MQDEVVRTIVDFCIKQNFDFQAALQQKDFQAKKYISFDELSDVVLNKLRVPSLGKSDVVFLAKRYIHTLPNQVHYEKMLDDFNNQSRGQLGNMASSKALCAHIRKACLALHNATEVDQYFSGFTKTVPGLLLLQEFLQACLGGLGLSERSALEALFHEIDTASSQKLTMDQIRLFVSRASPQSTKELQDEVLEGIATKALAQPFQLENLFKQDDPRDSGKVQSTAFATLIHRAYQVKDVDAKFLALRYVDYSGSAMGAGTVLYKKFQQDVQQRAQTAKLEQKTALVGRTNLLEPGLNAVGKEVTQRLIAILAKVSEYVANKKIDLYNILSRRESASGLILYDHFLSELRQQTLPLTDDDCRFLAENYLNTSVAGQRNQIDYRKFLSDLKQQQAPKKQVQSLTREQQSLYTKIAEDLKAKRRTGDFAAAFVDKDPSLRGYLPGSDIQQVFRALGYAFNRTQFDTVLSALDQAQPEVYNYKQLLELVLGHEEALRFFAGEALGAGTTKKVAFVLPTQPVGAKSSQLSEVGKRFIAAGLNYEEVLKSIIGEA